MLFYVCLYGILCLVQNLQMTGNYTCKKYHLHLNYVQWRQCVMQLIRIIASVWLFFALACLSTRASQILVDMRKYSVYHSFTCLCYCTELDKQAILSSSGVYHIVKYFCFPLLFQHRCRREPSKARFAQRNQQCHGRGGLLRFGPAVPRAHQTGPSRYWHFAHAHW